MATRKKKPAKKKLAKMKSTTTKKANKKKSAKKSSKKKSARKGKQRGRVTAYPWEVPQSLLDILQDMGPLLYTQAGKKWVLSPTGKALASALAKHPNSPHGSRDWAKRALKAYEDYSEVAAKTGEQQLLVVP